MYVVSAGYVEVNHINIEYSDIFPENFDPEFMPNCIVEDPSSWICVL